MIKQKKAASFVTTLNNNIKNINLSQISSVLSEYSLIEWKQGSKGYPELQL